MSPIITITTPTIMNRPAEEEINTQLSKLLFNSGVMVRSIAHHQNHVAALNYLLDQLKQSIDYYRGPNITVITKKPLKKTSRSASTKKK